MTKQDLYNQLFELQEQLVNIDKDSDEAVRVSAQIEDLQIKIDLIDLQDE